MDSQTARTAWLAGAVITALLGTVLALILGAPDRAVALAPPVACPAIAWPIALVDPAGVPTATHELSLRMGPPAYPYTNVGDLSAPGARIVPPKAGETARLVADSPGPLTVSAIVPSKDDPCASRVSETFEIQEAGPLIVTKLKGPGRRPDGRYPYDVHLAFSVKPTKTSDRSPITILARTLRKARIPGPKVRPKTVTYLQRPSDLPPTPSSRPGFHPCHDLVCPRRIGLFATGFAVRATPIGTFSGSSRYAPKGLTLTAEPPVGLPLHPRHVAGLRFTPFGLDLEVRQAGARLARLRVAGRCRLVGELSACRFKTLSTQLG